MNLLKKIAWVSCFIMLLALVSADAWFFKNRDRGFIIYRPETYGFFYGARPGIKCLSYKNGVLKGSIDPAGHRLRLLEEPDAVFDGTGFQLPLESNHVLKFSDENGDDYQIELELNYLPLKNPGDKKNCKKGGCVLQVASTDFSPVPAGPGPGFWIPQYPPVAAPETWTRGLENLKNSSPDFNLQLISFAGFMVPHFSKGMGVPSTALIYAHPAVQIKRLLDKSDQVDCANISEITAYTLNRLGFPARVVYSFGWIGSLSARPHSVNEILDPATGEWFLTDLTLKILFIENQGGQKLNLSRFVGYFENRDLAGLRFLYFDESQEKFMAAGYEQLPDKLRDQLDDFYRARQALVYPCAKSYVFNRASRAAKIKDYLFGYRYVLPVSASSGYWAWHFLFRATLYLTVVFSLLCGILVLVLIKKAFKA